MYGLKCPLPDVDECGDGTDSCECANGLSGCSSFCSNTDGSYDCSCSDGFTLDGDGRKCNGMYDSSGFFKFISNIVDSYARTNVKVI